MSVGTHEDKLFKNEIGVFNQYRNLNQEEKSPEELKEALDDLTNQYKSLLDQTRFLTWVSGRLEKKLHRANRDLNERNGRLEKTLAELVKATAGRNAFIIIYFIAIALFVLEEFFVEPFIIMFGDGLGLSIMIKLGIVLILKVVESFIEDRIKKKPKLQTIDSPIKTLIDFGKAWQYSDKQEKPRISHGFYVHPSSRISNHFVEDLIRFGDLQGSINLSL